MSVTVLRPTPVGEDRIFDVYRYAATAGGITSIERAAEDLAMPPHEVLAAIDHLLDSRLLRDRGPEGMQPVDPQVAAAALISPMEREIYQRREEIAQIQERIEVFQRDYASGPPRPGSALAPVNHVVGALEVRGSLKLAGDSCHEDVLVMQSHRIDGDEFDDILRICGTLLARGVTVRIACLHRSRADLTTRMKLKSLMEAGAEVRTLSHLPRAAVVFDRSMAVLLGCADEQASASRIQDGDVVRFLLDLFDHLWDGATPLVGFDSGYADVADDLMQTIAGLMAKGFTDEVIARKLSMSVRTARRHIATLMRELDAVSRFQAGVLAARRSLVHGG